MRSREPENNPSSSLYRRNGTEKEKKKREKEKEKEKKSFHRYIAFLFFQDGKSQQQHADFETATI